MRGSIENGGRGWAGSSPPRSGPRSRERARGARLRRCSWRPSPLPPSRERRPPGASVPGSGRRVRSQPARASRAAAARSGASLLRPLNLLGLRDRSVRGRGASIFRGLGVEVGFRGASDATYGEGPLPEVPVILLEEIPIVARRRARPGPGACATGAEPRGVGLPRERPLDARADRNGEAPGREREAPSAPPSAGWSAHEVIHAMAPEEPHAEAGLMSHSMNQAFLLGDNAPLDARCATSFPERPRPDPKELLPRRPPPPWPRSAERIRGTPVSQNRTQTVGPRARGPTGSHWAERHFPAGPAGHVP